jgi:hypothetical protein
MGSSDKIKNQSVGGSKYQKFRTFLAFLPVEKVGV